MERSLERQVALSTNRSGPFRDWVLFLSGSRLTQLTTDGSQAHRGPLAEGRKLRIRLGGGLRENRERRPCASGTLTPALSS